MTEFRKVLSPISLLLILSFIIPVFCIPPVSAADAPQKPEMGSFEEIMASFYDPNGRPMSCAHRAITYIGNPIPENSLAAIQDSIDHKVDIVELDIMRTKDGVYVLCHDNTINRTTTYNGSLKVSEMTYEEICKYPLLQYTGGSRDVYKDEHGNTLVMPTFAQALDLCRGKIMINLDKFSGQWANRMELYELVKEHGCLDIVMFKGSYGTSAILGWHKEIRAAYGKDAVMPNFCTYNSNRNAESWVKEIKTHHDTKTAYTVEAGFSDYTQPQSDPKVLAQITQYTRAFTNVLYESIGGTHSAKHKENSTGWSEVISLGYNIIQTNNAADLVDYIYANFSTETRDIGKGIDLLYFSGFRHNQTNYTIEIKSPSVKLYNGDYLSFKNVDFGSCEGKSLIASITEASGEGHLVVRKDSQSGEIIAKFDISKIGNQAQTAIAELQTRDLGVCDIYVCAEGLGKGYVSASKLSCADPKKGETECIVGASVFTRPGIAPTLPKEVLIVNEYGFSYKSEVVWLPIPEECYRENLSCFSVPGILKEDCRKIYANVTVLDIDMSGAAIWFDSQGEMLLGESGEVLKWYDRLNSVCATADNKTAPSFKEGIISFDGIDDKMVYDHSLSGKSDISIIINAKTDKKSTDYFSDYKINNSARYTLLHYPESDSWGSVYFTAFKNGIVCRFGSGENNNRGMHYSAVEIEGWSTVSAVKQGKSEKLYLGASMIYDRSADRANLYQAGKSGEKITATHEYAYIGHGIQSSTNYYYCGNVGDIVVFERTLNDVEIATLDAYFKAKNHNSLKNMSTLLENEFDSFIENNMEKIHSLIHMPADGSSHTEVCKNCSYNVTKAHSFKYSAKDEEIHVKYCSVCGYESEEAHSYQEFEEVYKCTECNAEKQMPLNSQKSNGIAAEIINIIIVSAVVLAAGIAFFVVFKKRNGK